MGQQTSAPSAVTVQRLDQHRGKIRVELEKPDDALSNVPLQERIDAALNDLAAQLEAGHTVRYHELVAFYARFHHYSPANAMLIMMQKPDANAVAGYRRWQELGRQVKKNAKAAHIWCPIIRKQSDDEDEDERSAIGFKVGYVFSDKDLIDAETDPIPVSRPALPDTYPELLAELKQAVAKSGVGLREVPFIPDAEGYYSRDRHEITLEADRDSHNQCLILLHEWTHALFHHHDEAATWSKETKEFEAETVAMVVARILGLNSTYANDYLLCYGATAEQLKSSFSHIHQLVKTMTGHLGIEPGIQ